MVNNVIELCLKLPDELQYKIFNTWFDGRPSIVDGIYYGIMGDVEYLCYLQDQVEDILYNYTTEEWLAKKQQEVKEYQEMLDEIDVDTEPSWDGIEF